MANDDDLEQWLQNFSPAERKRLKDFLALFPFENREIKPSDEDVKRILAIDAVDGVRLVDFWVAGQPFPDAIGGTFRTAVKNGADVVAKLLGEPMKLQVHIELDVFPFNQSVDVKFNCPPDPFAWGPGQPDVDAISEAK